MKVAELFAEIGFKVEGADELKAFETSLQNIASAARQAALAMRVLSKTHMPAALLKALSKQNTATAAKPTTVVAAPNAQGVAVVGAQPPGAAPTTPTAVLQGFKSLTTFAKQLVGFGSLAYVLKSLITSMTRVTKESLGASFGLSRFTLQSGLTRDELKRWESAAAAADVSQQEIQDQLGRLAQQAAEIPWGKHLEAASAGAFLGINMLASAPDILKQFGAAMQGKSFAQARMFAEQLGINPNVAYMMQQNKGVIPALPAGQALSDNEQKARLQATVQLNRLGVASSALTDRFVAFVSSFIAATAKINADFLRGYNLLLDPRGRPADWPLPRTAPSSTVHQTTVGDTTVTNHIGGVSDPQRAADILNRKISDAQYQRPPVWVGPVPAAQ